jgi:sortase (surface protein transpeptidase)
VTTANGETATYRITQQLRVLPHEVGVMLPSGKEQITLISCIGDKVYTRGTVTKKERLVTIAEPVMPE